MHTHTPTQKHKGVLLTSTQPLPPLVFSLAPSPPFPAQFRRENLRLGLSYAKCVVAQEGNLSHWVCFQDGKSPVQAIWEE